MIYARDFIKPFFTIWMVGLGPARKAGSFGTPDAPLYFLKGEDVPWWINCRWPFHLKLTFTGDVATFYENGEQIVEFEATTAMTVNTGGRIVYNSLLFGAPTVFVPVRRLRGSIKLALPVGT